MSVLIERILDLEIFKDEMAQSGRFDSGKSDRSRKEVMCLPLYPVCENDRQLLLFRIVEHTQYYYGTQQKEQGESENSDQGPPAPQSP